MKLKKIASLMLAGVMAVSMLAGCSDNGNTPDNNEDDNQIVTTGNAATYATDALSEDLKEYITVSSSSTLDGWVKDIATDTSLLGSNGIEYIYGNVFTGADNNKVAPERNAMRTALQKKVVDSNVVYVDDLASDFNTKPTNNQNVRTGSTLYVLSGALDEAAAVQAVVAQMSDTNICDLPKAIDISTNNVPVYSHNCEYDVEVSAVKVTNDSLSGESAWVIGVVITQTATEVANVQV